jgi:putative peptidoglycan lipid II flippase
MMATALVAAMTIPIVRSLFERGKFSVESTIGTAEALFFYALAIPVWGGLQILNRAFYARRDMWTPVLVGTAATVAAVPLYIILQNSFGLRGIALASTLTLTIYTGILAAVWYDDADGSRRIRRLAADVGRAVPLAVIGGGAAFAVAYGLNGLFAFDEMASLSKTLVSILIVVAGTVAFAAVAVGLGSLLHDWLLKPGRASGDPLPVTDDAADSTPVSADVDST